jgi:hypothetical protein
MKNKTMTYGLMAVVFLIWGLVFYRVFAGLDSGEENSFIPTTPKLVQSVEEEEENVLVLIANYRDPFLGGTSRAITNSSFNSDNNSVRVVRKPEPKKEIIPIDWSFLDYVGIVLNKETQKKVGLLVISGKEYMVNEKEVINGVTILSKERDSIQVQFNGVKNWIKR